ncbi:MAG: 16S rRNA (guanine(966)-N(2))-methyltransferase RsmD [Anaerolineae bacterium]|nr:16S rRNA (guanine(966)-N(2))-methyltransferase RsmD [Anaerolineae bacterium]
MRVISGKAKGRKLYAVPGPGTRPMTDRAKSALFSIFGESVAGARFLDLFAGTGQVGIEALSRGAEQAVFIEAGQAAIRTIYANLKLTQLTDAARVIRGDVFRYLMGKPEPYDYVYIAPPQYRNLWIQTLRILDTQVGWLSENGWAIVQINPIEYETVELQNLTLFDQRRYGGVMLCFYTIESESSLITSPQI